MRDAPRDRHRLEVIGAGMVAAPEIAPLVTRATRAVLGSRLAARVRRLILDRRDIVISAEPGTFRLEGGGISATTDVGDDASPPRSGASRSST